MIFYAIVLYNKQIKDSNCLLSLFRNNCNNIIVFDNSDSDDIYFQNKKFESSYPIEKYLSSGKNIGLSKSYNEILNWIFDNYPISKYDYICWLDDDTIIDKKFFSKQKELSAKLIDIIAPKILGQNGIIYSPNEYGVLKNKLVLQNGGNLNYSKFNAINSCLTVNLEIYRDFRYSDYLFLDQVDQLFFDLIRNKKYKIGIMDVLIKQNFSQRDKILSLNYLNRFEIRTKDILRYGAISPVNNVFYSYLKNCLLAFNFFRKTRNFSYLKMGISSIWKYKK